MINKASKNDELLSLLPEAPSFSTHILTSCQLVYTC